MGVNLDLKVLEAGPRRELRGTIQVICGAIGILMSLFHLYVGYFGVLAPGIPHEYSFRAMHLVFALMIVFLLYPASHSLDRKNRSLSIFIDCVFFISAVVSIGYIVLNFPDIAMRPGALYAYEYWLAAIAIIVVLEGARRTLGWQIPALSIFFLLYAYYGAYIPGLIGHRGYSAERLLTAIYVQWDGIFGAPLSASAQYVFLFILFASILKMCGASGFFVELAYSLFGGTRGGPAKAAIVGSSIMGTITGSSVANVVGTGTFTIPLMKETGYSSTFAAAVEAVASSGGQIMPPIMGAAAFVMAEMIGVPYITIMLTALVPALLYYLCLFFMVDLRAIRLGLVGKKRSDLPNPITTLKEGWYLLSPLFVIIVLMVRRSSILKAGFWGIIATFGVALIFRRETMKLGSILKALRDGAYNATLVACSTACVGIIISTFLLTGLAAKASGLLIHISGGNLLILLILTALMSLLMGMGLSTIACYIILAVMIAPALVEIGVPVITAHFFVFYFGILSHITPPVCIAAYAAAGIAGSNAMETGWAACKLGFAGFIVPFYFVLNPELLLGTGEIGYFAILTAIIGIMALAQALEGQSFIGKNQQLLPGTRISMFIASLLLLSTDLRAVFLGLIIFVANPALVIYAKFKKIKTV